MGAGRDMVITVYGHDKTIEKIAVSAFDKPESFFRSYGDSDASTYCDTLNNLELNGNSWVFARVASENAPYTLDLLLPLNFDIFLKLDDKVIQRVLREVDSYDIKKALKSVKETVQERIFNNMTERAAQMIKEDMLYMGPVGGIEVKKSQEKIINVIRHLEEIGEIIIPYSKGEATK